MGGGPIAISLRLDDPDRRRPEEEIKVVVLIKEVHHPIVESWHPLLHRHHLLLHLLFTHPTGIQLTLLIMATTMLCITHKFNSHNTTSICTEHLLLAWAWALPITMVTLTKPQGVHFLQYPRPNASPDLPTYTIPCRWTAPSPLLFPQPQGIPFLLLLIHRWQHSELAPRQKLELFLQKVQIPKRTHQYVDGSVKSFNCIILTSLSCPSSLFSFLKFSTIYMILWSKVVASLMLPEISLVLPSYGRKRWTYQLPFADFPPFYSSSFILRYKRLTSFHKLYGQDRREVQTLNKKF